MWDTVLIGPTATYVNEKNDYERGRLPLEEFLHSARTLLPELQIEDMHLAYSGIRPKLVPPSAHGIVDFIITRDPVHSRAIQLVGIESPGLTAALAIARHVAPLVSETLN
jgi:glycerol-3-phosphate dehydrogenase